MLGVLLVWAGSLMEEISGSIGKWKMQRKEEDIYVYGFWQCFTGILFFLLICLADQRAFVFSWASLPILALRCFLDTAQMFSTLKAIELSDRSSFAFLRSMTIPLLLLIDLIMGYSLKGLQIMGVLGMMITILIVLRRGEFNKKGLKYMIFSAINPAITISLFKFNIDNFNSVAADQIINQAVLLMVITTMLFWKRENPLKFLKQKGAILQPFSHGLAILASGYAYLFDAPSVIIAASRGGAVFWSTLSGIRVFGEKGGKGKMLLAVLLVVLLVVLM